MGLTNPPVCADPKMSSERGFPGQKRPSMPQLDQSCMELESKPLRHTTEQTDLLEPKLGASPIPAAEAGEHRASQDSI